MPEENSTVRMMGVDVRSIELAPFEGSAAIKVEMALKQVLDMVSAAAPLGHPMTNAGQKL